MIKTFLILIILQNLLFAQQIILVVANDFNSSKAKLTCYENNIKVFNTIEVNLGKNGLGWGIGEITLKQNKNEPQKQEGDKKAPAGIFKLKFAFGYKKLLNLKIDYLYLSENEICVDDSNSKFYNQIMKLSKIKPKSYEKMRRKDNQYLIGIYINHNYKNLKNKGSCIFMHIEKEDNHPTAGCTSMKLKDIKKIVSWLNKNKNPILIQIPKSSLQEIKDLYPKLPIIKSANYKNKCNFLG